MISIQFPEHPFTIKQTNGKDFIFDALRKQWLLLTPEEWVRQNFIQYLIQSRHYPSGHFVIEKELKIGELKKRFDVVIYNKEAKPWMLIECKAMAVNLTEQVINQALRYNQKLGVYFMIVTNGMYTRCFQLQPQVMGLTEIPAWDQS